MNTFGTHLKFDLNQYFWVTKTNLKSKKIINCSSQFPFEHLWLTKGT